MEPIDELSDAEMTRLILRLRKRLAEAERAISRARPDEDERAVLATILASLREIAGQRPHLAPKLEALIERYRPMA
jgi:hypothetical protein